MHLLIPAAGRGQRMGSDRNKLLLPLLGRPILAWTLLRAAAAPSITWIGVLCQSQDRPDLEAILADLKLPLPVHLIPGGTTRQASVYNGLQALPTSAQGVLIHDGARCLATPDLFERCAYGLRDCSGLIAAVPVKDTIKVVQEGLITATPPRAELWAAQTPQGFTVDVLKDCHQKARAQGWEVTDDAALFERCRQPVQVVMGEETNLKITTPEDLILAEAILTQSQRLHPTHLPSDGEANEEEA